MEMMLLRLALCSVLLVLVMGAGRAEAAQTLTVSNSSDADPGSLRALVGSAADGDTVVIPASITAPILLTSGQIVIKRSITISGAGAGTTVIDGNNAHRSFDIADDGASHPEVTISDVTIRHGHQTGVPGGGAALVEPFETLHLARVLLTANDTLTGDAGGAVFDQGGTLTIDRSTISDNHSGGDAGGVFIEDLSGGHGVARISDSTISGNTSPSGRFGGGISNGGVLTVERSTLSGNSAGRAGSGVATQSFADPGTGQLTLVDSTVVDNTSTTPGFEGGGIHIQVNTSAPVLLLNDTIAGNMGAPTDAMHAPNSVGGVSIDSGGTVMFNTIVAGNQGNPGRDNCDQFDEIVGDHNIEDENTCRFQSPGNLVNTDPLLTQLTDNGGPTLTRQPIPNSPAIGAADATRCPATDQRGVPYFSPNPCDIGAVDTARPGPPPAGGGATGAGAAISKLGIHPTTFAAAGKGGSIAKTRKRHTGTTVSYTQLTAGKTSFVVRARKCVRRKSHRRSCRFVKVGGFSHAGKAGANRLHFTGRVHRHKLHPGRYRLDATANRRTVRRSFRIVP